MKDKGDTDDKDFDKFFNQGQTQQHKGKKGNVLDKMRD